jgi:hypothetical protein
MCNYRRMTCLALQRSLIGVLLAFEAVGCSGFSESGPAGFVVSGAQDGGVAVAKPGATSMTGCTRWPVEQLFPLVGPLHYGVNPKPCVVRSLSQGGDEIVERASYKDGRISRLTRPSSGAEILYTYEGNTLVRELEKLASGATGTTKDYRFAQGAVFIDSSAGGANIGRTRYSLDELGYPLRGEDMDAQGATVASWSYHYQGCRLSTRVDSALRDGVWQETVMEYFYDSQGRITTREGSTGSWQIGYECAE